MAQKNHQLPKFNFGEKKYNFLITGGTGFIGSALVKCLVEANQKVTVLTRNKQNAAKILPEKTTLISDISEAQHNFDIIINLAGETISQRWTEANKIKIYDSRILTTRKTLDYISNSQTKPKMLISGSAIGYYASSPDRVFDENSVPENTNYFSQKLCADWENEAKKAEQYGVKVVLLRTGVVLGQGGALEKMLPAFKLGLGGKISTGKQYMSWVHINDELRIIEFIINNEITGPVNATSSNPVTNEEFSKTLARSLNRPSFFTVPSITLKLAFGQMAEELLINGQKVLPKKLQGYNFNFQFNKLEEAI